jgi:hypothetical protein
MHPWAKGAEPVAKFCPKLETASLTGLEQIRRTYIGWRMDSLYVLKNFVVQSSCMELNFDVYRYDFNKSRFERMDGRGRKKKDKRGNWQAD